MPLPWGAVWKQPCPLLSRWSFRSKWSQASARSSRWSWRWLKDLFGDAWYGSYWGEHMVKMWGTWGSETSLLGGFQYFNVCSLKNHGNGRTFKDQHVFQGVEKPPDEEMQDLMGLANVKRAEQLMWEPKRQKSTMRGCFLHPWEWWFWDVSWHWVSHIPNISDLDSLGFSNSSACVLVPGLPPRLPGYRGAAERFWVGELRDAAAYCWSLFAPSFIIPAS